MPELKGFDVWVEVNGVRLEEYKIEASGDKVACWIPSEAGKVIYLNCQVEILC